MGESALKTEMALLRREFIFAREYRSEIEDASILHGGGFDVFFVN
jgi:hypothetical protein